MGRAGAAMRARRSLGARQGVHALYPGGEGRALPAVTLLLAEDAVEGLVVLGVAEGGVLQEREGGYVGGGERVADQVAGLGEHPLEAVERGDHLVLERGDH